MTPSNPAGSTPLLETTDAVDRQQEEAIAALEYLNDNEAVRCQCCNNWIRIVCKLQRPKNDRMHILEKRIKWIEYDLCRERSSQEDKQQQSTTNTVF